MINVELFMLGLLITSVLTGLTTEAVKNILIEHNATYRANTLAGIIAFVLSLVIGAGYIIASNTGFNSQNILCIVGLVFMSWLCAMVGYDKVIQAISQFKTNRKDEQQ